MIKILNLYAGIGGNRQLWGDNVKVTAVELNESIAKAYKTFFPNDKVIIGDAHEYLLNHYKEYDFIWSSPPCPTHSKVRKATEHQNAPVYPDMTLYQEILFLQGYFMGKWVVENVISWYDPLIKPFNVGSHYFWSNFVIPNKGFPSRKHDGVIEELQKAKGFDITNMSFDVEKKKILRNCVEPKLGLHVFTCAFKDKQERLVV